MNEILVSPVIKEEFGKQKTIAYLVHYPNPIKSGPQRFTSKKRAFLFAHEKAADCGLRVREVFINKNKLDVEKM